jgi:hypothetical protein
MQSKGRKSIVEELGTEEEKRIIAQARAKMAGSNPNEDSEKAGAIAQQISTRTIKKVIIGVLVMLLMMPMLEADRPNDSKYKQLVQLHNVGISPTTKTTASCYTAASIEQSYLFNLTLNNYLKQYPTLFFLRVRELKYFLSSQ